MTDLTEYISYKIGKNTELDRSIGFISDEFRKVVLSHIIGNYVGDNICPLYLAIHGTMGNGKTYQTLRICSEHDISMYYISAAELSRSHEADCTYHIKRNLEEARTSYKKRGELSVFIIDDFHLSIASTEVGIGKTVNSQLLTGFLMNLADSASQGKSQRIPFILLGNDFKYLYPPLTRDGRMDFYEWNPDIHEKIKIVETSMQDLIFSRPYRKKLSSFVNEYSNMPISFFIELRHDLYREQIGSFVMKYKEKSAKELVSEFIINRKLDEATVIDSLKTLAEKRCQCRKSASIVHESREGLTNE